MLYKVFKSELPSLLVLLLIISLLLFGWNFINAPILYEYSFGFFADTIISIFNKYSHLSFVFGFVFVTIQALWLNRIVLSHGFVEKRTMHTALVYILLSGCFLDYMSLNIVMLMNFTIIYIIYKMFDLYLNENSEQVIFKISFVISITSLVFFPFLSYVMLMIIGLMICRIINWKKILIILIGVLIPYIYLVSFHYWNGSLGGLFEELISIFNYNYYGDVNIDFRIIFLSILTAITVIHFIYKLNENTISVRKNMIICIWVLIFSLIMVLLFYKYGNEYLGLLFIPCTIIYIKYLENIKRKIIPELFIIALVIMNIFRMFYY